MHAFITKTTGVHEILFALIFARFLQRSGLTLLNNSWHVVAQLKRPELDIILEDSAMSTDGEVKRKTKEAGKATMRFRLSDNGVVGSLSNLSGHDGSDETKEELRNRRRVPWTSDSGETE